MTFFLQGGLVNQGQLIADGIFIYYGGLVNLGDLIQA